MKVKLSSNHGSDPLSNCVTEVIPIKRIRTHIDNPEINRWRWSIFLSL